MRDYVLDDDDKVIFNECSEYLKQNDLDKFFNAVEHLLHVNYGSSKDSINAMIGFYTRFMYQCDIDVGKYIKNVRSEQFSYVNCSNIILSKCTRICWYGFANNDAVETISASHVTHVGSGAFAKCTNLKSIDLSSCHMLQPAAFINCHNLKSIYLNNIEYLELGWFSDCEQLQEIYAPKAEKLVIMGDELHIFKNETLKNLKKITLSKNTSEDEKWWLEELKKISPQLIVKYI